MHSLAPLTVELQTSAGTAYTAGIPVTVALSSSSATTELSTGPDGPWSSTLALPIVSGASSASFYVRDATVGSATITAAAVGKTSASQAITVAAPAPTPPDSPPPSGGAAPPPDLAVPANPTPAATIVEPAPAVARPALVRPALRAVGAPTRVTRARGVATLSVRFSVGGAARLEARVTPLGSARPLTLLAGTTLAETRVTKPRPTATARVSRAATYVFKVRIGAAKLIRGRTYLVKLTVVDADGRRRSLTIRARA